MMENVYTMKKEKWKCDHCGSDIAQSSFKCTLPTYNYDTGETEMLEREIITHYPIFLGRRFNGIYCSGECAKEVKEKENIKENALLSPNTETLKKPIYTKSHYHKKHSWEK